MRKDLPIWITWILAVVAVISVLFGAYYMNEYLALRQAVIARENAVEGFISHQSVLNSKELCRRNWFRRFGSWATGSDSCN